MAIKQLNSRIQWKKDTVANWESNNPVLLDGEIIIVDIGEGETRFKIGDGTSTYAQLPFQDEYVLNKIPNVSEYVTAQDPVSIVNTIPPTFGGYTTDDFVLKTEVVNSLTSNETQLPLSANQGKILNQSILQNSSSIENLSVEVDNKVDISGAAMKGMLIAQSNTNYTVGQVRNIYLSTSEPTNNIGNNGDIWIVYEV